MFLFAVALSIGAQRHEAKAEDLLQSLQASARCASSFSKPEL
jgi:hypothetical protein